MLCNKLKQIRLSHDLSLNRMAEIMNVTRNTVRNYEDGKTAPDIFYIKKICKEFNVDLETLVYSEKEKTFKCNAADIDSYEFEGTFLQIMDNCKNEQEASLIYDIFLSLVQSIYNTQLLTILNDDYIKEYVEALKSKNVDFDDAYRSLYAYLHFPKGSTDIYPIIEKINKLLTYYEENFKAVFDNTLDDFYGRHEMD